MSVVNDTRLMIKVCEMYYLQNMSQKDIALKLSISRPQISRVLAQARKDQIVTIKINNPYSRETRLEQRLIEKYQLHDAFVIERMREGGQLQLEDFAQEAAGQIDRYLSNGQTVGVMSGTTINSIVQFMKPSTKKLKAVIPLVGGIGAGNVEIHANNIAQRLAALYGSSALSLNAPALVTDRMAAELLRKEPSVAKVLQQGSQCDVALVGIGSVSMDATNVKAGGLTEADLRYLKEEGACASSCCSYIDSQGREIGSAILERAIGHSLHSLQSSKIIGIAIGEAKTEAIRAALRTGEIHVFVTNLLTAQRVLEEAD